MCYNLKNTKSEVKLLKNPYSDILVLLYGILWYFNTLTRKEVKTPKRLTMGFELITIHLNKRKPLMYTRRLEIPKTDCLKRLSINMFQL